MSKNPLTIEVRENGTGKEGSTTDHVPPPSESTGVLPPYFLAPLSPDRRRGTNEQNRHTIISSDRHIISTELEQTT